MRLDARRAGLRDRRLVPTQKGRRPEGRRPFACEAVWQELLCSSLQLAAGADLHAIACGALDCLAGLRVAARASRAVGALDSEPTRDGDLRALFDRLGEG